ncbi:YybH family protein [Acinetobacter seifertii]|uniref:YybH family protein n=1 Tax=Acinetobacter seifertii TaxID=1530123 RepID=UPI0038623C73
MNEAVNSELAKIEAAAVAYLTAFNRADVTAILATYTDEGVLMGPGMPAAVGKEELAIVYPKVYQATGFNMAYEIKEVQQISVDWAFVRSATEGTETNKSTGIETLAKYHELFLLCKLESGEWKIARYCTAKISPV